MAHSILLQEQPLMDKAYQHKWGENWLRKQQIVELDICEKRFQGCDFLGQGSLSVTQKEGSQKPPQVCISQR